MRVTRWSRDRLGQLEPGGIESWMDPNHSPHLISEPLRAGKDKLSTETSMVSVSIGRESVAFR